MRTILRLAAFLVLALVVLFCPAARSAPSITVSASAVTLLGTSQTISLTCTLIDPAATGKLSVSGVGIISNLVTSSATPGTTATCGPLYGDDVVLNGNGNVNSTYYKIQTFVVTNGIVASTPVLQNFYALQGSGTIDLATASPTSPGLFSAVGGNVSLPGTFAVTGLASLNGGFTSAGPNTLLSSYLNETVSGTATNFLAQLVTSGGLVAVNSPGTATSNGAIGICVSGCGQSGNALIAERGEISCFFDGATVVNDYVTISSTVGGKCHDSGATYPTTNGTQVLGRVLSTNAGSGLYLMNFFGPEHRNAPTGTPAIIASGTAAMTTAAIAAISGSTVTCGSTVTVSASGVFTTDPIIVTPNGAESSPNTGLRLSAWPTANNVNFAWCNPTASSQTPAAETLNWRVVR